MSPDPNPQGAPWLVCYSALGIGFGQLQRQAVAIVAMNPRSLWTPPLWGWGSLVSCTVYTFTLNLHWRLPLLHPEGWVRKSTIYGNEYPRASRGRVTYREASSFLIAAMAKRLQFRHDTHSDIDTYSTTRASATEQQTMILCFVCPAGVRIATEKRLQFRHQHWHRHILEYLGIRHRTTAYEHLLYKEMTINASSSFVQGKLTSPLRSISNFDAPRTTAYGMCYTDSTTHDWDR